MGIKAKTIYAHVTTWALRLLVVGTVCVVAAILVASNLGGNGETQRRALEGMLGIFFGHPVKIHTLNQYQLFPNVIADFEGAVATDPETQTPVMILQSGYYAQDLYERFFGSYPIIDIRVDHLLLRPGFFGPYDVHIRSARVDKTTLDQTATFLTLDGTYGAAPLTVQLPMDVKHKGAWTLFRFVGDRPILARVGRVKADLFLRLTETGYTLSIARGMWGDVPFTGEITAVPAAATYDISLRGIKGCGNITALTLQVKQDQDFVASLLSVTAGLRKITGSMVWPPEKPPVFTWDKGMTADGRAFEKCFR